MKLRKRLCRRLFSLTRWFWKRLPVGTLIQTFWRGDPAVSFYFAKIFAGQGDKERAISYLNRALDEGFTEFDKIKTDPLFAVLAMDEGYTKVLDRIASLTTSNNQTK